MDWEKFDRERLEYLSTQPYYWLTEGGLDDPKMDDYDCKCFLPPKAPITGRYTDYRFHPVFLTEKNVVLSPDACNIFATEAEAIAVYKKRRKEYFAFRLKELLPLIDDTSILAMVTEILTVIEG